MASYQGPGVSNPVYDVSQSVEVRIENDDEEPQEEEEQSMEKKRTESNGSMLEFLVVNRVQPSDSNSIHEEREAILIDDGRIPCKDDAIIDLNIDSKPLFFVSFFLLVRIPRHYPDKVKTVLTIAQTFVTLGMLLAIAYDMGAFDGTNTLTNSQWDNFITSVKNVICNAKFPLLYVVGIFYFRSRHLEGMLSEVRLTKRYWKYGRKILIFMIAMVYLFTVIIPTICNLAQMSFANEASPEKIYRIRAIMLSFVISLVVRSMSLSVVFAFILVVYLIYCQVRLFKEQIQKWPREDMGRARDSYINICQMVRKAERSFQPFLLLHFIIFLVLLIPLTISCVEQFEAQGSYTKMVTRGQSMPYKNPITIAPSTALVDAQNHSALIHQPVQQKHLLSRNQTKKSPTDEFNDSAKQYKEKHTDTNGIIKVALMTLADVLETVWLYGLLVLLIGKVDKCMRAIHDTVRMLKFGQQKEQCYMFQNAEDVSAWDSVLSDARGIQLMGFNLASFKAAVIMLLFPFVSTVFRFMLRHVNITP